MKMTVSKQLLVVSELENTLDLLVNWREDVNLGPVRTIILTAVRKELQAQGREVPEPLMKYCNRCGSYNVPKVNTICTDCAHATQPPQPGSHKRFLYVIDKNDKVVKYLGQISGKTLTDLSRMYTTVSYKNGFHGFAINPVEEFRGRYTNADMETVVVTKIKIPSQKGKQ